jgi:hypothetical protein
MYKNPNTWPRRFFLQNIQKKEDKPKYLQTINEIIG